MRIAEIDIKRPGLFTGLLVGFALLLLTAAATAAAEPAWRITSLAPTSMSPDASATVTTATPGSASPGVDETQEVTVTAGIGQFRLGFGAETTADLAFNASAAQVQAALEALTSIGTGNVEVTGGPGANSAPEAYIVTFTGALGAEDVEELSAEDGSTPLARTLTYRVLLHNVGQSALEPGVEPINFDVGLPSGLTALSTQILNSPVEWNCDSSSHCEANTGSLQPTLSTNLLAVKVAVDPAAAGVLTAEFDVSGGGAAAVGTVDPTTITTTPPVFGIDAFDQQATADAAGGLSTQAGGRPYGLSTSIDFNSIEQPNPAQPSPLKGDPRPVEPIKDVVVDLPPGLLGNTAGIPQCSIADLANGEGVAIKSLCDERSQVGQTAVRLDRSLRSGSTARPVNIELGPFPVFNMVPPPSAPARFGYVVAGSVVTLDVKPRSSGDYGLRAELSDIPEGLAVLGSDFTLWGVPSDPVHTPQRSCPGNNPPFESHVSCDNPEPEVSFFRNPTSCEDEAAGSLSRARTDSWLDPGDFEEASSVSHEAPGYPYPPSERGSPQGPTGCEDVPFEPALEAQPTTNAADSPSGLDLHLKVPQGCWTERDTICQSDLRDSEVELPAGMSINPASASGQDACSSSQIGLITPVGQASPIHFDEEPAACPNASKIGTVTIETPLLEESLNGSVFLAKQQDNPFGSLLAMYLVAEGSGVVIKLAGEILADPVTGQLTTRITDAPQLPFSDFHVELFGGPRAPLRTPAACGRYAITATLTPWSGNAARTLGSQFGISDCGDGGFDPKLNAGTANPLAGRTSPFILRLQREDRSEELRSLQVALPPGLLGYLNGIPYCPDSVLGGISGALGTGLAQETAPSCPAASMVGTVTVGAGAGPQPFYTASGRAYLAGPYKGAPLSLAVVAPAVAGPFDLGSVVVRNAIQVDPATARLSVISDPLPSILHGIPLDLRDIRVAIDRDHFTLNPTNCEEMQIDSRITSVRGASVSPSQRFQVTGCDKLAFKPKLSISLKGKTRRGGNPALTAVLQMPQKGPGANISKAIVTLPGSEFLAQDHLDTVCTRVQYAAGGGGGAGCPAGSVYGRARAFSPLLDNPLEGPVYLRSNGGERELPDLVASLGGQIHVDLVGYIDSDRRTGGLRTTFAQVPDAPVSKFVLKMGGGKKSLLSNHVNICRGKHRASVKMDAQNGKIRDFGVLVKAKCGGNKRRG